MRSGDEAGESGRGSVLGHATPPCNEGLLWTQPATRSCGGGWWARQSEGCGGTRRGATGRRSSGTDGLAVSSLRKGARDRWDVFTLREAAELADLQRATVFLSASFPSGERGERFLPYDPSGIADAVSAFSRAILGSNGTLAFGGHPTITPLVLMISRELRVKHSVTVFQSRWYEKMRLPEVDEIEKEELGLVTWTPKVDDREEALRIMRTAMIRSRRYAGALFVGGMEGIPDEYAMMRKWWPGTPCMPVTGTRRCGCETCWRLQGPWSCSDFGGRGRTRSWRYGSWMHSQACVTRRQPKVACISARHCSAPYDPRNRCSTSPKCPPCLKGTMLCAAAAAPPLAFGEDAVLVDAAEPSGVAGDFHPVDGRGLRPRVNSLAAAGRADTLWMTSIRSAPATSTPMPNETRRGLPPGSRRGRSDHDHDRQ